MYTELGIVARSDKAGKEIVDELEECARSRYEHQLATRLADGKADLPRTPQDRLELGDPAEQPCVVDVWMHEQDIRRAVGRPGGMNTAAAAHTVATFTRASLRGRQAGGASGG